MMECIINIFYPKVEIGKMYVHENDVGAFYPLIYIPKKINKTHVLYDYFSTKYPNNGITEGELELNSFRWFYKSLNEDKIKENAFHNSCPICGAK